MEVERGQVYRDKDKRGPARYVTPASFVALNGASEPNAAYCYLCHADGRLFRGYKQTRIRFKTLQTRFELVTQVKERSESGAESS